MRNIETVNDQWEKRNSGFEIMKLSSFEELLEKQHINQQYRTNFYTLIYVNEGQCIQQVDFAKYPVKAGQTLLISNNRIHQYDDFDHAQGYIIRFTEGFLCEYLSNQNSGVKEMFQRSHLNPHIKSTDLNDTIIKGLLDVMNDMYNHSNDVMDERVMATTFITLSQIIVNSSRKIKSFEGMNNEMFVQFTELVDKYLNQVKSVSEYAKLMHVSDKTVNQVTRKAIDMSAKQYIINQLIQQIRRKLSFERKSINEIAYELGFSEPSNMTRFFKKNTGESPKEFRNKVQIDKTRFLSVDSKDLDLIKDAIEKKIYHIPSDVVVSLHKHAGHDEVFYCIKGSGFGIVDNKEVKLTVGESFTAKAGVYHALKSDTDLYVVAFLVPVIDEARDIG